MHKMEKAKKEKITRLLDATLQQTLFYDGRQNQFSPAQVRTAYYHYKQYRIPSGIHWATARIQPKIPDNLLEDLVQELRPPLNQYMDSENKYMGNGLNYILSGPVNSTVTGFIHDLIRGAAILGSNRVADLLCGWIAGKPFHYKTKAVLTGITIKTPLMLEEEGLQVNRLPSSSHSLPTHVPSPIIDWLGDIRLMGKTLLSIDCKERPALYKPPDDKKQGAPLQSTWGKGRVLDFHIGEFCEALSLTCNHGINRNLVWQDYGELTAFTIDDGPGPVDYGFSDYGPKTTLSIEQLEKACDIFLQRKTKASEKIGQNLGLAINRWVKSKRTTSDFMSCFIDLRIALEALFLGDGQGEKQFRLAVHGAWYLGEDSSERHKHFNTLRKIYDLASRFIHAGQIEISKEDRELLTKAQDLCREGILKRLEEDKEPNWNEIIFGA